MICENCGCQHDGSFGSSRFCSRSCANSRNINQEQITSKEVLCIDCGKTIIVGKRANPSKCRCNNCLKYKQAIIRDQAHEKFMKEMDPEIIKLYLIENSLPNEEWKEFFYDGISRSSQIIWHVSNLGRIAKNKNISYGHKAKDGYMRLGNMKGIHVLVAENFIPMTSEDLLLNRNMVDHIDGDRQNNKVTNLRWCTNQENCTFPLAIKHRIEAISKREYSYVEPNNKNKVLYNNGKESFYFIEGTQPEGFIKSRIK